MAKESKKIKVSKLHLYIGLIAIILIGTIVYTVIKYQELTFKQQVLAENQDTLITLQSTVEDKKNDYFETKKEHDDNEALIASTISKIFPTESDQNNLLREIESFFTKNHLSTNVMFLSSISFENPKSSEECDYRKLPFSMSIESSESNFFKFLEYMETSGSLENEVRLMDLDNVTLNLGEGLTEKIIFTAKANAYFQKEVVQEEPTLVEEVETGETQ